MKSLKLSLERIQISATSAFLGRNILLKNLISFNGKKFLVIWDRQSDARIIQFTDSLLPEKTTPISRSNGSIIRDIAVMELDGNISIFLLTKTAVEHYVWNNSIGQCRLSSVYELQNILNPVEIVVMNSRQLAKGSIFVLDSKGSLFQMLLVGGSTVISDANRVQGTTSVASLSLFPLGEEQKENILVLQKEVPKNVALASVVDLFSSGTLRLTPADPAPALTGGFEFLSSNFLLAFASSMSGPSNNVASGLDAKSTARTRIAGGPLLQSPAPTDSLLAALSKNSNSGEFQHVLPGTSLQEALHVPSSVERRLFESLRPQTQPNTPGPAPPSAESSTSIVEINVARSVNVSTSGDTAFTAGLFSLHRLAEPSPSDLSATKTSAPAKADSRSVIALLTVFQKEYQSLGHPATTNQRLAAFREKHGLAADSLPELSSLAAEKRELHETLNAYRTVKVLCPEGRDDLLSHPFDLMAAQEVASLRFLLVLGQSRSARCVSVLLDLHQAPINSGCLELNPLEVFSLPFSSPEVPSLSLSFLSPLLTSPLCLVVLLPRPATARPTRPRSPLRGRR
jgi:hypothetical protein